MNKKISTTILILGFLAIFSLMTVFVWAADWPYGVTNIDPGASSRPNLTSYPASSTPAEAGNITEINLTGISTTKAWQGYYGEITGTITLENSDGDVFYNWTANEPKGEIYAVNTSSAVSWATVTCFQHDGSEGNFNVSTAEGWYGIEQDDADGINETFLTTTHPAFQVGTTPIGVDTCPATTPYVGGAPVDGQFENILLTDNDLLIFTTIIENDETGNATDVIGFDGVTHDFQLLVAEDGHDGQEDFTTTYWFYAEIE